MEHPSITSDPSESESRAGTLAHALAAVAASEGGCRRLHALFGGFNHETRNILNGLKLSLYLARRSGTATLDPDWAELESRYALIERFVVRFQQVCRPLKLAAVRLPLEALVEDRRAAWTEQLERRRRRLVLVPPPSPAPVAFDPGLLGTALDDLVAWRATGGDPAADLRLAWSVDAGRVLVEWDETAPARTPRRPRARSRPPRPAALVCGDGDMSVEADVLASLTLPFLTRVLSAHGGTSAEREGTPWRLTLRWPLDARPTPREPTPCCASHPSP